MKEIFFRGLCTALVTPFRDNKIHRGTLEMLIQRQIDSGVQAIVLSGTTGESPTLSDEEKGMLFRWSVRYADGRIKIIAGTGSNNTAQAIRLSQIAEDAGADGVLAVTPYYNKATDSGIIQYYESVAQSVSIPIICYQVPSRTGVSLSTAVCRRLSEIPGIAGLKDAEGNIMKTLRIISENQDRFPVWSGCDDLTVPIMSIGGQGVISVVSNIAPTIMNAMVTAALQGDYFLAGLLQRKLKPLCDLMFCQVNPIPVKEALNFMGYDVGSCRSPLDGLPETDRKKLEYYLTRNRIMLD